MSNVAIIPARGGSKRIPRKNIKPFLGYPIIEYSIKAALESGLFSEVMVSTDDSEIAEIAIKAGAKVPFFRSEKTANDFAHIGEVLTEVIETYNEFGKYFDMFCCILPTAPFLTSLRIIEGYNLLNKSDFDSVFPVLRFSYPIQRALKIEDEKVSIIQPDYLLSRSQDLMPAYHDSGQFYWCKTNRFLDKKVVFTGNSGAIILSDLEVQDIDSMEDWELAEIKYKIMETKKARSRE